MIGTKALNLGFLSVLVLLAQPLSAADRPIDGKLLKIRATRSGVKLTFVSRDPDFFFPPIGGFNDPTRGSNPLVVDIFTQGESPRSVEAPSTLGRPGWRIGQRRVNQYVFRGDSPFRRIVLREGRLLRVRTDAGLDMTQPLGAVAVRVRSGANRSCALFDGATIERDEAGFFRARNSSAAALASCDDAALLGALGFDCAATAPPCGGSCPPDGICAPNLDEGYYPPISCGCIYATQPCGGTAPACNGECPSGEECVPTNVGVLLGSCTCTPIGVVPCGGIGDASCGAACSDGLECQEVLGAYGSECTCTDPDVPCGPAPGPCPLGSECAFQLDFTYACVPVLCGTFPTCGGSCSNGLECRPVSLTGITDLCLCTPVGVSCDSSCGGAACPAGRICTVDTSSDTCSCQ